MFLTFFLLLYLLFLLSFSFCLASSPIRVNGNIFTFYSAVNSIFPIGTFNYFSLKKQNPFINYFFNFLKKKKRIDFIFRCKIIYVSNYLIENARIMISILCSVERKLTTKLRDITRHTVLKLVNNQYQFLINIQKKTLK